MSARVVNGNVATNSIFSNNEAFENCAKSRKEYTFDNSSKTVTCTYSISCSNDTCSCISKTERYSWKIAVFAPIGACLLFICYLKLCRHQNKSHHGSASRSNTQSEATSETTSEVTSETQTESKSEQRQNIHDQQTVDFVSMEGQTSKYLIIDNLPPYVSNQQGETTLAEPSPPQYQPISGHHATPPCT